MFKFKKVQLDIYEDLEGEFYLALYHFKRRAITDPYSRLLQEAIYFENHVTEDVALVNRSDLREAYLKLKQAYEIFAEEDKKKEKYIAILQGFSSFRKSALGKNMQPLYIMVSKFLKYKDMQDNPGLRAGIAFAAQAWCNNMNTGLSLNTYYHEMLHFILLPDKKKEIESRMRCVELIHEVINKFFPDHTDHYKMAVTGFFSVPFQFFLDKEGFKKEGIAGSYAEHIRDKVRFTLNRKSKLN